MITALLLMVATAVGAQRPNHYITFSVQGGEANTLAASKEVKLTNRAGYQGAAGVAYELRAKSFFINLGAQIDWQQTGQEVKGWTESYAITDQYNNPWQYRYHYSFLQETQHNLQVAPVLMMGGYIGQYLYIAAGVKARLTLSNDYSSQVLLTTGGLRENFIQEVYNQPIYGFYPTDTYKGGGKNIYTLTQPVVAPVLEIGAKLPIHTASHRIAMRVGGYVEYGIPMQWQRVPSAAYATPYYGAGQHTVMDYRWVNTNHPAGQLSQQNLKDNLQMHTLLASDWLKGAPSNLTVGVKLTVLFNVTAVHTFCNCDQDFTPAPRTGGTRIDW